jgi:hypothetical protein
MLILTEDNGHIPFAVNGLTAQYKATKDTNTSVFVLWMKMLCSPNYVVMGMVTSGCMSALVNPFNGEYSEVITPTGMDIINDFNIDKNENDEIIVGGKHASVRVFRNLYAVLLQVRGDDKRRAFPIDVIITNVDTCHD